MEPAHTIGLELGERTLPVQVQRVRTARSSHTGQRLTELQGVATTTDPTVHQWLSLAPAGAWRKNGRDRGAVE